MPTVAEKRVAFRQLHESGCFILPNPWDVGTARYLQHLGFKALATTSAGFAWSRARADNHAPREMVLQHLRDLVAATDVPINADFENGFGRDAAEVRTSVALAVETGVAGLSIEDSTGDRADPLFPLEVAVERLRAARDAIDAVGGDTLLVGRAECFVVGRLDLDKTVRRLRAYAEAGADCLYAPGERAKEQIEAVARAVAPRPVNVLVAAATDLTLDDYAAMGVRRVSVGGGLAAVGWNAVAAAATQLAAGSFSGLLGSRPAVHLNELFRST